MGTVPERQDVAAMERIAASTVRRMCDQHGCRAATSGCADPNHRRDANFVEEFLKMLGLPIEYVVTPVEEPAENIEDGNRN